MEQLAAAACRLTPLVYRLLMMPLGVFVDGYQATACSERQQIIMDEIVLNKYTALTSWMVDLLSEHTGLIVGM